MAGPMGEKSAPFGETPMIARGPALAGASTAHARTRGGPAPRGRVDGAGLHQLDEAGDVPPVVAVAGVHREVLAHGGPDGEKARLLRVDADDRQGPGLGERVDGPRQHLRGPVARVPVVPVGALL